MCSGAPILIADLENTNAETLELGIRILLREARLQRAAVYLHDFDAINEKVRGFLLGKIEKHDGIVFVPSKKEFCLRKPTIDVEIPHPDYLSRLGMWKSLLGEFEGVDELSSRFRFGRNKVVSALESARNKAKFRNPANPSLTLDDLYEGCRAQSSSVPFSLKITPKYIWDDLVLPADKMEQLREVCSHVKHYTEVHEGWGFAKHSSANCLNVLFSSPSGTGKTMAAEILAHELRLNLYKIDLRCGKQIHWRDGEESNQDFQRCRGVQRRIVFRRSRRYIREKN